jgi:hypothetical protein
VFIIGSGSREFSSDVKEVKEILKGFGLEGYFALLSDKEKGLDSFCDKICAKILNSVFCIAMLNDPVLHECPAESAEEKKLIRAPRANVYYEFGLAVALGKKVIPLVRKDMKPPFDVQHLDAILYENGTDLKEQLTPIVRETLKTVELRERKRKESRKTENVEGQVQIKPSDTFRDKAFPIAFFVLFLMVFLPFRLAAFWIFGLGFLNLVNAGTVAFVLIFAAFLGIGGFLFGRNLLDPLVRVAQKGKVPYLFCYAFFVLIVFILNLTISLYSEPIRVFFDTSWQDFRLVCFVDLLVISTIVILSHFPIAEYHFMLENEEYKPNPKIEIEDLFKNFEHHAKLLQRKLPVGIVLATLILTVAIVPMDIRFGLFTPSYHNEGETFSHSYPFLSDELYLFIYSFRNTPELVQSEYKFYRLAQTEYTIYPAKLPQSNLIRIPNPTNITSGSTQNPSIDPTYSTYYDTNIGSVYTNVSKSINYFFVPNNNNFTGIDFNVTGIKEPVIANLTYWKLVNPNVSITTANPVYTNLGNGTWLEKYTFLISNNEKIPLTVMALDFDRFMFQVVNTTTTKVYSQGQEWPYVDFVFENRRLGLWDSIGSGYALNLTVTFQSSDVS